MAPSKSLNVISRPRFVERLITLCCQHYRLVIIAYSNKIGCDLSATSLLGTAADDILRGLQEFRHVLDNLPDLFSERCPPLDSVKLRYQRALLHESVCSAWPFYELES